MIREKGCFFQLNINGSSNEDFENIDSTLAIGVTSVGVDLMHFQKGPICYSIQ